MHQRLATTEHPVEPLELFFDLVFAFGFTQVTTLLSEHPTWAGLGHALLILTALWWAWSSYAWMTNALDPDDGLVIGAILVAAGAMFVTALAVPEAFAGKGVVFGLGFLIVNVMQVALYTIGAREDRDLLRAIVRLFPLVMGGAALILIAGFLDGTPRTVIWLVAIAVGFFLPVFVSVQGWRVQPAHFVERHGLIVIIAIGESLVAIGIGARSTGLGGGVILGAVLALFVAMSFWLAYFDFFTIRGRQLLSQRVGDERVSLARDVYTYAHLPMIVGIVLFAFATKGTLAHLQRKPDLLHAIALCGGPATYVAGFVALRIRVSRSLGHGRPVALVALLALIPLATHLAAVVVLALVALVWAGLHTYELVWWREARADARAQGSPI